MKAAMLILFLTANLFLPVNSFALKNCDIGESDTQPPNSLSKVIIVADEYTGNNNLEMLAQKLNDPDPFARVEAVQVLGEIQNEQSLNLVFDCLADENFYVRAYAAEALGKIGQIDIDITLLRLFSNLDDPSPYVRAMMVEALAELQDKRAVNPIKKLLEDEDESVRKMAVWALKNIEESQ